MKALTLLQPWAQLVIDGHKKIETRSWNTHFRGTLLIHAGKSFSMRDLELCYQDKYFNKCIPEPTKLITGALLGTVDVLDCVRIGNETEMVYQIADWVDSEHYKQERAFGYYHEGRYMWKLGNVQKFAKPVYGVSGAQGLWDYNRSIVYAES